MKKLILIVAFLSMGVSIPHGQEYKVVCKRISGCPVINGTCPTCNIIAKKKSANEELDAKIDRMLREYKANLKKEYPSDFFEVKRSNRKPSGWETYVYPTWKGLRVLY